MKGNFKKGISVALSLALTVSSFALPDTAKNVNADNLPTTKLGVGSIGTGSNEPDAAKLPRTQHRENTDLQQIIITVSIRHLIQMTGQVTGCGI